MTAVWLKMLHVAALAFWGGGLLALSGLVAREHRAGGGALGPLWRHRASRFAYDVLISPAAVLAIGSGTALIFVTRPLEGWFFLKLAAVAGLVGAHMLMGHVIDRLDAPEPRPTRLLTAALPSATLFLICLVLGLVLLKPPIDAGLLPDWLLQPVGFSSSSNPTPT